MAEQSRRELERRLEQSRRLTRYVTDRITSERLISLVKEFELILEQEKVGGASLIEFLRRLPC